MPRGMGQPALGLRQDSAFLFGGVVMSKIQETYRRFLIFLLRRSYERQIDFSRFDPELSLKLDYAIALHEAEK